MRVQTILLAFAAATASAAPLLQRHILSPRDEFPSLPAVSSSGGSNKVVEVAGSAADVIARREVAVPAVNNDNNQIFELEGETATTAASLARRDDLPLVASVTADSNQIVGVVDSSSSSSSTKKRDVAVPVLTQVTNKIFELVGTTNSKRSNKRSGIVPIVVDGSQVMAMEMLAEDMAS